MNAIDIIQSLGYPIFVSLWLMFRVEKRMDTQHREQHRTNVLLSAIVRTLDGDEAIPETIADEASGVLSLSSNNEGN